MKSSGNPFTNSASVVTLKKLCSQLDSLTEEQKLVLFEAEQSIMNATSFYAFINADAGTGKTYTLNTLIARLTYVHKVQVISAAFTGIASTLILNGRTFHSQFKATLKPESGGGFNIRKKSKLAENIKKTKVIVIDEAPQINVLYYVDLDEFLRDLMEVDEPFGGIRVILAGDFKQTLPIVRKANQVSQVRACIKSSDHIWNLFKHNQYSLTKNMRVEVGESEQEIEKMKEFMVFLRRLGTGVLPPNEEGNITLPDKMVESDFESEEEMQDMAIEYLFGNINDHVNDTQYMMNNVILCPLNKSVREINDKIIEKMHTTEFVSYAADTPSQENPEIPVEFLNTMDVPGLPLYELRLKVGMPIMVIRNINKKRHICNGTRLIVERVTSNLLYARNPARNNEQVILPRIELESDIDKVGMLWKRRQFPVYPAFAFSLNKSQGQTISGKLAIYLWSQCFSHGQLYVATTRASHPDNLKYFIKSKEEGVRNVVITQII